MSHRLTLSQFFIDEDTSKVFLKQKLVIAYFRMGSSKIGRYIASKKN